MSWDQGDFLTRLKAAVDAFDRERTAELCRELSGRVEQGEELQQGVGRRVLATLRRKCYFDLMEQVADVLRSAGFDDDQVRRQYAQALIDQGEVSAAVYVLELLESRTADDPQENAEARGLLGRVYKQQYVNAVRRDPQAAAQPLVQRNLRRAVGIYHDVYGSDPAEHLWHGINTAALAARAKRDDVQLDPAPDAAAIAQDLLRTIEARTNGKRRRAGSWTPGTWPRPWRPAWRSRTPTARGPGSAGTSGTRRRTASSCRAPSASSRRSGA